MVEENPEEITNYLMSLDKDIEVPPNFAENFYDVGNGGNLRYFQFIPESYSKHIVIIPGLNTLVMSWYKFLILLKNEGYAITYIETREKPNTKVEDRRNITYEIMITDVIESLNGIIKDEYIVVGSSMGSNLLINALSRNAINPTHTILIGPYADFSMPWPLRFLRRFITDFNYKFMIYPLIKLIVLPVVTNKKADPFQYKKYNTSLKTLDPIRFRFALKAYIGTNIWTEAEMIDSSKMKTKILLIGAGSDKLHGTESTRKVSEKITGATFIEFDSNSAAHDQPMIDLIKEL
jgi:alpha-beta hydrolase superfamily lysophospholipase